MQGGRRSPTLGWPELWSLETGAFFMHRVSTAIYCGVQMDINSKGEWSDKVALGLFD